MTVYIDSNTFAANPALYADAEKKKPLPRVLPAVQLREGKLNVAFLGDRAPTTDMVLSLSAVLAGTQTQILAEYGDAVDGADVPTWEFPFALNSQALADVLSDKQRASLLVGVIATAEGYRREWQILVTCDPTATGEFDPEQVESAKTFADAAKRSADNAAESESNAAQSATHAAEFATASAQSSSASAQSASNAKASEDNSKASEDNAATSATNASQSASDAAQSKTAAANSASAAATSEENAKASEDNAATSATNAAQSASDAAQSKTAAANSASAAATSASNASSSASAANTSAGNAANSASAASTSANNASDSASAAKASEDNAKASETAASESAESAAYSAENLANVYTKRQLDGVDTGAEVTLRMNEIIAQLKDWEEVTGETLPLEFWEALMAEFQRWQKNPTAETSWYAELNPYYSSPPEEDIIIDFSVKDADGVYQGGARPYSFSPQTEGVIFLPDATDARYAHSQAAKTVWAIYPNALVNGIFRNSIAPQFLFTPTQTNFDAVFLSCKANPIGVYAPKAKQWTYSFQASYADLVVDMSSAETATNAFNASRMSAPNIAATLDTLPKRTADSGGNGVIGFAGSLGAAHVSTTESITVEIDGESFTFANFPRFTTDDEAETLRYAVARASAKGWTVNMGNPIE